MRDEESEFTDFNDLDFGGVKEEDVKIIFVENNLWSRLEKSGNKISFARDLLALYRYMDDPYVPTGKKLIVAAALIYFITPIDKVPRFIRFFETLDELGVMTALIKFLGKELVPYYEPGYRS
jgi:uncharacterized membrane protein YkvA (DUF1232 family)